MFQILCSKLNFVNAVKLSLGIKNTGIGFSWSSMGIQEYMQFKTFHNRICSKQRKYFFVFN